jgi:multidrug efflux pump subunit AcrA (membrane-fusion protein)
MSARVTFLQPREPGAATEPAVLVPGAAIRRDAQGDSFVWVVADGRVRRQRIESGGGVGDRVRITSGLQGGEAVVVDGEPARDGQRVTVH